MQRDGPACAWLVPCARAGWASRNGPELMGLQAALAAFSGRTFLLERGVDRQRLFRWVFGKRFSVKGTCPSRKKIVFVANENV